MKKLLMIFAAFLLVAGCCDQKEIPVNTAQMLIPKPVSLVEKGGNFKFTESTTYGFESTGDAAVDAELEKIGQMFSDRVEPAFGYKIEKGGSKKGVIFTIDPSVENPEGYRLEVKGNKVIISASAPAGIFYGTQTLYQLLPIESKSRVKVEGVKWTVPQVIIEDAPRLGWRGNMLDPARHFLTLEQIRNHIDEMTQYKFNKLHIHLADDQGWRIEIKGLPNLTSEKIAFRPERVGDWGRLADPTPDEPRTYGGFYTQDEMRDLIKYAADRYIEIIPEIDVPGHSMALIQAYPEIYCFPTTEKDVNIGNPYRTYHHTLCVGNPKTMDYMKIIFGELAELFPTEYLHIGGDEAVKTNWLTCPKCQKLMKEKGLKDVDELQSYFIHQMDEYILSINRKMIGWDEILEGGLAPNAIVMSWRDMEGGITAAKDGHEVIMTPMKHCYVDLYQGDPAIEPRSYAKCALRDSYDWDPIPEGIDPGLILGIQANMWSETITTQRMFEYLFYPRNWSLAEVAWTPQELRDWNDVFPRLEYHMKRADVAEIDYAVSVYNVWLKPYKKTGEDGKETYYITFYHDLDDVDIYYTWDNTPADKYAIKYEGDFILPDGPSKINIRAYRNGEPTGIPFRVTRADIIARANSYWDNANF